MTEERKSRSIHVLVVDDEPGILSFVSKSLSLAGYEVTATDDGEEASDLVKSTNPDVVLLDVLMSPVSGFDVAKRIRAISEVPIIVFTARADLWEMAKEAGATTSLSKPFKPRELIAKIEEVLQD